VSSLAAEADVRLLNTANGLQTARLLTHREKKPAGSKGRGAEVLDKLANGGSTTNY